MDSGIGEIFADALIEVASKSLNLTMNVLSMAADSELFDIVGAMNLNSKKSGMVLISANEADMRKICLYMTGSAENEVSIEDVWDALCEIVNMTAGNAKVRLHNSDYMYALTPPFVICGENISIITKKRSQVISRVVGNGDISLKMKILY